MLKKQSFINLLFIVFMAISISIFDFNNLSWEHNTRSYIGFILAVILLFFKYAAQKKSKTAN